MTKTAAKKSVKKVTKRLSPYGEKKFRSVDEYHMEFDGIKREQLDKIRDIIRKTVPKAEETISYNMPAFRQNKILVYYAAGKNHIGFYPTPKPIAEFSEELKDYKTSKGAIQFPLDKPFPVKLIKDIVKFREKEDKVSLK